ncbi:unnamed protein product, partial [Rangifer tarandus platyrhynchus]
MRSEGAAPGPVAPLCGVLSLVLGALLGRGKRPGTRGVSSAGAREVLRGPREPGREGAGVVLGTWVRVLVSGREAAPPLDRRPQLGAAPAARGAGSVVLEPGSRRRRAPSLPGTGAGGREPVRRKPRSSGNRRCTHRYRAEKRVR